MTDDGESQDGRVDGEASAYSQGYRWEGDDAEALSAALEAAFGYRGNVTLLMRDGGDIVGYLFNREAEVEEPYVDILPAAGGRARIPYSRIRGVVFSGKDTAEGKSWETWLEKYNARKASEARGEAVRSIDRVPGKRD